MLTEQDKIMTKPFKRLRKQLYLDRNHAWLFGVCAGLANYCRTDPAIVRVGAVVSGLFMTKLTIAIYLVAWLILDNRSSDHVDIDSMQ